MPDFTRNFTKAKIYRIMVMSDCQSGFSKNFGLRPGLQTPIYTTNNQKEGTHSEMRASTV
jgi:hypothetical protein